MLCARRDVDWGDGMTAYESMTQKLRPTGLYTLADGSEVCSELRAYAVELDRLYTMLTELLREALIPTAETDGITERERYFGKPRSDLPLEQRRAILLTREGSQGGHSLDDLNALIASCGVTDCTVTVTQRRCKITIAVNDALTALQKADFEKAVHGFVPVTFETTITYRA